MADTREKFSSLTVAFHWTVGLTIIALVGAGIYMADLPKGEWRSSVYGWHKVIGTTVLMLAAARLLWRWRNGIPVPAAAYPEWQRQLAHGVHVILLAATILLPLTGAAFSYAAGHPVPVLGLVNIGPPEAEIPWLRDGARFLHGWAGWVLAGIVALHMAGALKHHVIDRDGTLRRMLGARIG